MLRERSRDAAASVLNAFGLTRPAHRASGKLTVVTFHRVLPEAQRRAYPYPGLAVTPDELRWFLAWLREHYTCETLSTAHRALLAGEEPERPWLCVTFDDAQLDNHSHAAPVLAEAGIPATFFAPVAHVETGLPLWHDRLGFAQRAGRAHAETRSELVALLADHGVSDPEAAHDADVLAEAAKRLPPAARRRLVESLEASFGPDEMPPWAAMMGWRQISELAEAGHEIGSHSMTHPILTDIDDTRLEAELAGSRSRLESELGSPVAAFCYPNGDADARVEEAVRAAGYARAVTTRWGRNGPDTNPLALRRCDMRSEHAVDARGAPSAARLAWRLSGLHPGLH